jgi:prepilin-type N-terminal cleavage/methylation domain-containing protein
MRQHHTITDGRGFTLIEVITVVAIVGILATVSVLSYVMFGAKAKAVEAEVALAEISRLETLYYEAHGQYSSDLLAIGYAPTPSLKYYTVEVRVAPGTQGVAYRATATPTGNVQVEPWVLTRYENGSSVLEKVPASVTAGSGPGGGSSGPSDSESGSSGSSATGAAGNGSTGKGPGNVVQTINDSSPTGGSVNSGGQQGTTPSSSNPSGGR